MGRGTESPGRGIKALFVNAAFRGDGGLIFTLELIRELRMRDLDPKLLSLRPGDPSTIPDGFDEEPEYAVAPGMRLRYAYPLAIPRMLRAARNADVLVSVGEVGDQLSSTYLAGRLTGKPVVAMVQSHPHKSLAEYVPSPLVKRVTRFAYPRLHAAVCASRDLVRPVLDLGTPRERISVIPNGINPERIRALAKLSYFQPPTREPFVLALGRLAHQKGFDLLIKAHAKARAEGARQHLVIVGDGPERAALEDLGTSLGVSDSVSLPGFLANPFPALADASAFCLSSRYEGWGLVLGEALALGVPVIASDCVSGPSEVLDGGSYGDLVKPESVDALADGLLRHYRNPERLREKARSAAARAHEFSIASRADAYVQVLQDVVRGDSRASRRSSQM